MQTFLFWYIKDIEVPEGPSVAGFYTDTQRSILYFPKHFYVRVDGILKDLQPSSVQNLIISRHPDTFI